MFTILPPASSIRGAIARATRKDQLDLRARFRTLPNKLPPFRVTIEFKDIYGGDYTVSGTYLPDTFWFVDLQIDARTQSPIPRRPSKMAFVRALLAAQRSR
jgi:hypothetical protein